LKKGNIFFIQIEDTKIKLKETSQKDSTKKIKKKYETKRRRKFKSMDGKKNYK
jgi:hypothetical protein